jgi:hypothetical protein
MIYINQQSALMIGCLKSMQYLYIKLFQVRPKSKDWKAKYFFFIFGKIKNQWVYQDSKNGQRSPMPEGVEP